MPRASSAFRIDRLELFHVRIPLREPFETSFGRERDHECLLVCARSEGAEGWGEAPAAAGPFYSGEDVHTAWHMIRDWLGPRLRGKPIRTPSEIPALFAFVRGNPMAKAGLEGAVWDLYAKRRGVSLAEAFAEGEGARGCEGTAASRVPREVDAGISIGIQATPALLERRVARAVEQGYRRIKIKIRPGWDEEPLRALRRAFPDIPLMADANAAYHPSDEEHLRRLDEFGLTMLEQPLAFDDLVDHSRLARALRTPICLDESIRSAEDGRRAAQIGACRIINIKMARVGGATEAIRLHDVCRARGIPVWCGGLLETGVGRLHNLALATLPNFSYPGDLSPSERWYREDVVDPPVRMTERGTLPVPAGPGIGHAVVRQRVERASVRRERLW